MKEVPHRLPRKPTARDVPPTEGSPLVLGSRLSPSDGPSSTKRPNSAVPTERTLLRSRCSRRRKRYDYIASERCIERRPPRRVSAFAKTPIEALGPSSPKTGRSNPICREVDGRSRHSRDGTANSSIGWTSPGPPIGGCPFVPESPLRGVAIHPPPGGPRLEPSTERTIDVPGTYAAERQAPPPGGSTRHCSRN